MVRVRLQKAEVIQATDKENIEEKVRAKERVEKGRVGERVEKAGVILKDDVDAAHPEKVLMETQDFVLFHRSFFREVKTGN